MTKIEIPSSNPKLLILLLGSLAFVAAGCYILLFAADHQPRWNPVFMKVTGVAAILFFGVAGIYTIRKMMSKPIGLIIDENGIFNNSNAVSTGLIKWSDITEISTQQVLSTQFVLIHVSNPEEYIGRAKGFAKRMLKANNRMYGTPISIASNTLQCSFIELKQTLQHQFDEYRSGRDSLSN